MKIKWNGRYTVYSVIIALLALVAVWIWYEPAYLKELKKFESVKDGLDEPKAVMKEIIVGLEKKDRKKLFEQMFVKDGTEFQKVFGTLIDDPDVLPLELKAAGKMVHSHRKDNISFYYHSPKKMQNYQFVLLKNARGEYKVSEIGSWKNLPDGLEEVK